MPSLRYWVPFRTASSTCRCSPCDVDVQSCACSRLSYTLYRREVRTEQAVRRYYSVAVHHRDEDRESDCSGDCPSMNRNVSPQRTGVSPGSRHHESRNTVKARERANPERSRRGCRDRVRRNPTRTSPLTPFGVRTGGPSHLRSCLVCPESGAKLRPARGSPGGVAQGVWKTRPLSDKFSI
jgi:hypothetical protein